MAIEAGRLMLGRVDKLLEERKSFAIETTLAARSYRTLVERAKRSGYHVTLLFFWLPSPEMAEHRVAARVASGGHNVPKDVIHRRYWSGLDNLFDIFVPIVDQWSLYDNSGHIYPIVIKNVIKDRIKLSKIKQSCLNKKKYSSMTESSKA